MCRLFGFQAQIQGPPRYLTASDQAFVQLSQIHADGWGLAAYQQGEVKLKRGLLPALHDPEFKRFSESLHTQTLIAHLRLATVGENKLDNNHPFVYQNWVFAHNGNIKNFSHYRELILSQICSHFRAEIQGETDSELIFYFILSELERWGLVSRQYPHSIKDLGRSIQWALENLQALIGAFSKQQGPPTETYISFLMSNGEVLFAHQGGQPLYYRFFSEHRQAEAAQVIFCSEPLDDARDWLAMPTGALFAVDSRLKILSLCEALKEICA